MSRSHTDFLSDTLDPQTWFLGPSDDSTVVFPSNENASTENVGAQPSGFEPSILPASSDSILTEIGGALAFGQPGSEGPGSSSAGGGVEWTGVAGLGNEIWSQAASGANGSL